MNQETSNVKRGATAVLHRLFMPIGFNVLAGLTATVIWDFDIGKLPLWKWLLGWVLMCAFLELGIKVRDGHNSRARQ